MKSTTKSERKIDNRELIIQIEKRRQRLINVRKYFELKELEKTLAILWKKHNFLNVYRKRIKQKKHILKIH
jgi:hypothetical protein